MKTCPHPKCQVEIPDNIFACPTHWSQIPSAMRRQLCDALWNYKQTDPATSISLCDLIRTENSIKARLGWKYDQAAVNGTHYQGMDRCHKCGKVFYSSPDSQGEQVLLEPDTMVGDLYYIIGFTAVRAADLACSGSYTPFTRHKCRPATPPVPSRTRETSATPTPSG